MRKLDQAEKMIRLHVAITESFSEAQVRQICDAVSWVNYADLLGVGERDKIRELILHANRRDQMSKLIEVCSQIQPDFHWEDKSIAFEITGAAKQVISEQFITTLATRFSLDDLRQLAFYLGVDFEETEAPHGMFDATHDLSKSSRQWPRDMGIDCGSIPPAELSTFLKKMWAASLVEDCERGDGYARAVAICVQLRPDVF